MPFAVVLTRAGRCFYLRLSRFSARKGISGAVYVLSQCYGILPIYKPPSHSVKESRHFSANVSPASTFPRPQRLHVLPALRHASPFLDQDNACACPEHL